MHFVHSGNKLAEPGCNDCCCCVVVAVVYLLTFLFLFTTLSHKPQPHLADAIISVCSIHDSFVWRHFTPRRQLINIKAIYYNSETLDWLSTSTIPILLLLHLLQVYHKLHVTDIILLPNLDNPRDIANQILVRYYWPINFLTLLNVCKRILRSLPNKEWNIFKRSSSSCLINVRLLNIYLFILNSVQHFGLSTVQSGKSLTGNEMGWVNYYQTRPHRFIPDQFYSNWFITTPARIEHRLCPDSHLVPSSWPQFPDTPRSMTPQTITCKLPKEAI